MMFPIINLCFRLYGGSAAGTEYRINQSRMRSFEELTGPSILYVCHDTLKY
jgi:hypothetical protein